MTTGKSTYFANKLLDHTLGRTNYTPPATVWVGLHLSPLNEGGSGGAEVSVTGYERKEVANNTTEWPDANEGIKTNGNVILFITAQADWGLVDAVAIYDAPTDGNVLYFGSLDRTVNVTQGDACQIAPGAIRIREK